VLLGGVWVEDGVVLRLAEALRHKALSRKLSIACTLRSPVVNLTVAQRHAILAVLDPPPPGLEGLRKLILANPRWML
jgi:uncharacterized protein (DUF1778 family)